jgi:hypothetical protein
MVGAVFALCLGSVTWAGQGTSAASGDSPLTVTPYSGFNAILTRAPYVTDLAQTTAYVNWATDSMTPGSVEWAPAGGGGSCPSSVQTWATSANPEAAPTSLPDGVDAGSPDTASDPTMTSWAFTVTGATSSTSEYQNSVELTGLTPNTTYCYAVFSSDTSGAVNLLPASEPYQSFTTLITPNTSSTKSVTFDVMGDTGENYQTTSDGVFPGENPAAPLNPDQSALDAEIGSSGAQFLLMAGDVGYSGGTASDYGDLEQTGTDPEVSNIFGPSYFPLTGGIPTFTADGNHGQNPNTLRSWPSPVTAATSGGTYDYDSYSGVDGISAAAPDDWYAFSDGNVRIYVLDAAWADNNYGTASGSYQADADEHWQSTSPEYQWLQADLAAHPGGIKMAVFHYPLESDNDSQPTDTYLSGLDSLLSANGVDIAFNGHAHTYQRFVPRQPGQVISYVTGGGGGVLEPVQGGTTCAAIQQSFAVYALGYSPTSGTGTQCGAPSVPASEADVFNFLKVTVSGTSVTVDPTNAAGNVFDPQTYSFGSSSGHSAPSTPGFVSATATSSSSIQLSWTDSTESGGTIAYYGIDRNGTRVATVNSGTDYVDTGVAPGTRYTYTVTAYDTSGNASSPGTSNTLAVPTEPTGLQASLSSPTSVELTWSPSTEKQGTIESYQINRNGVPLNSVAGSVTSYADTGLTAGSTYSYTVTAFDDSGGQSTPDASNAVSTPATALPFSPAPAPAPIKTDCSRTLPPGYVVGAAALPDGSGYYEVDALGDVAAFGAAKCYGALTGTRLNRPIVGMAVDPATGGYWLVASDGGVFTFNAPFLGSAGAIHLNKPIVGIAAGPGGVGYWMVASDGGIFAYGVPFYGSTGAEVLNKPIVGMSVDPATGGYWLVASDGGIFAFHAPFFGSTGNIRLNKPIVSMAPLANGSGYRMFASDGGVFTYRAPFFGSTGAEVLNKPIIEGIDDAAGDGYWLIASDGGVFTFRAPFYGSGA